MSNRHPDGPNAPQALRAKLLRKAIEGTGIGAQARFASRFEGVSQSRWSNVERGHPISRSLANTLVNAIPGLSRDWLENGQTGGLSLDLWQKLEHASRDESDENASTGR